MTPISSPHIDSSLPGEGRGRIDECEVCTEKVLALGPTASKAGRMQQAERDARGEFQARTWDACLKE